MKHFLLFFLIIFSGFLYAQTIPQNPNKTDQNGKRQGKWTILYDKNWNIIQDAEKASFYRLITYKDDKPVGKIYDKFADGKVQMEAELLADRPKDIMHGETIYYREDGTRQSAQIYEQGAVVDEFVYDEKGGLIAENWQILDSLGTEYKKTKRLWQSFMRSGERAKLKAAKEFGKKHENYIGSLKKLGDLFLDLGRYSQAEPYYQAALEAQKERVGEKHEDYGKVLNNLGMVYYRKGDYTTAEATFSKVLDIYKAALGENNLLYAGMLHNLGVINYDIGKFDSAKKYCLEAMTIREALVGKDHLDYANSLTFLGNLYNSRGDYQQGKIMHEEATGIYKAKENAFYSSSLGNLAISYHHLSRYVVADSLYQEARAVIEKNFGKKHPNYAETLTSLGSLYKDMYKFDRAESVLLEGVQIYKELLGEKHPRYANSLQTLAQLYIAMHNYTNAESLLQQKIKILQESIGEKNIQYVNALGDLATLYLRKDDIKQAEPLFLRVLEILEEVTGKNDLNYAGYLSNLGVLYYNFNNFPKAEQCYQEALTIRANILGKKHSSYAASLITFGNLYNAHREYSKALSHFTEAIQIYLTNDGGKSAEYAYALNSLGNTHKENNNYEKAEEYYLRSLEVYKAQHIEDNLNFSTSLNNLALIYQKRKEYNKADSVLKEAVFLAEKYLGKNHPNYATFAQNLALTKEDLRDFQSAYKHFREVSDFLQNRIKNVFPALSQKEKEFFFQDMRNNIDHFAYFSLICLRADYHEPIGWLYDNILANKGLLLNTQNKIRNRIFTSNDSTLLNLYHTWQNKRNVLAQAYLIPLEERDQKGVGLNQLEDEANRIEKELSQKSGLYADGSEASRFTWQQLRESLKPGEVAVEVLRFGFEEFKENPDSTFYAFLIVTPFTKQHPEMVVLKDALLMEETYLKDYKRNINAQRLDQESYHRYWEAVQQKSGKSKTLFFSGWCLPPNQLKYPLES
ncbi:MAG: tetratricopeptide repeat protein [Bacteroidia bacterium]|nr:tetratricopeptide repeat protein [Bacteroidia bacterium]